MKTCPGRKGGVGGAGAEVIEGEFSVGEDFVPEIRGKVGVAGGEGGDQVILAVRR